MFFHCLVFNFPCFVSFFAKVIEVGTVFCRIKRMLYQNLRKLPHHSYCLLCSAVQQGLVLLITLITNRPLLDYWECLFWYPLTKLQGWEGDSSDPSQKWWAVLQRIVVPPSVGFYFIQPQQQQISVILLLRGDVSDDALVPVIFWQ